MLLLFPTAGQATEQLQQPLFSQAAAAELARSFSSKDISYLLMDADGNVLAERWEDPDKPVAPGSLVKPFLAVAYGEQHDSHFPQLRCLGTRGRCWLPQGHGTLGLEEAIVQSCNAYFLQLAAGLDHKRALRSFAYYGLAGPSPASGDEALIGLGEGWKETPLTLARAFLQLEKAQRQAAQGRIVNGMQAAAQRGTARGVDAALGDNAALAKTGTAACSHFHSNVPQGAVDGFAVVFYPAEKPRLFLLVRVHGFTGAQTATVAGKILRSLGAGIR